MIRAIVTDIEGTTSSISFVHDVLFPYAAERLPEFVRTRRGEASVRDVLNETARLSDIDADDTDALIEQLLTWITEDRKVTPLKALQGLIWEAGYREGAYRAHVYPDAVDCLHRWHEQQIALYVYSSGSVYAQKLFFSHSEAGDLTPLFNGYFDTTTGPKREAPSYHRIAESIGLPADEILFLSDIEEELDAAADAGMHTYWLIRDNATSVATGRHPLAHDFHQVLLA